MCVERSILGDACEWWAKYLRLGSEAGNVQDAVDAFTYFVRHRLLSWLEVMGIPNRLEVALGCLSDAKVWLNDVSPSLHMPMMNPTILDWKS
jgi:hypothetical protein